MHTDAENLTLGKFSIENYENSCYLNLKLFIFKAQSKEIVCTHKMRKLKTCLGDCAFSLAGITILHVHALQTPCSHRLSPWPQSNLFREIVFRTRHACFSSRPCNATAPLLRRHINCRIQHMRITYNCYGHGYNRVGLGISLNVPDPCRRCEAREAADDVHSTFPSVLGSFRSRLKNRKWMGCLDLFRRRPGRLGFCS